MSEYIRIKSGSKEKHYREQTYEKSWTIYNWAHFNQTGKILKIFEFETGKSPEVNAKWGILFEMLTEGEAILKAQCPIFDPMFRSDLSENQTGVVNIKDITGKTMGIFLHLFYSGELPSSWNYPDTVFELTYAAGKYQLTNFLELLDKMLGI